MKTECGFNHHSEEVENKRIPPKDFECILVFKLG